jgi:hypothetical protein
VGVLRRKRIAYVCMSPDDNAQSRVAKLSERLRHVWMYYYFNSIGMIV